MSFGDLPVGVHVIEDTTEYQLIVTRSTAGWTEQVEWKPGFPKLPTEQVVLGDLVAKARQAVTANTAFLAVVSPTNAQVLAQVQRLTREVTALIRLQGVVIDGLQDLMLDNSAT